jgi:diguanylate cyclase (GGDEF)-like protein/PAS domain S-box-containing protein
MVKADGTPFWGQLVAIAVPNEAGAPALRIVLSDFSERKRADMDLREQEEFFHLIAENIGDFIAVLDLEGRRVYNSPSYKRFFGGARDLRGTDSFAEIHPQDQERVKQVFRETVQTGVGRRLHYRFLTADGSIRQMESLGSVIRDDEGKVARVVVVSRDITERKLMEEEIHQLAFYDPLTTLPNRRLLNDRLGQTMAATKRSDCYGALMFLDLDNFKPLNDRHGHDVGDLLLIQAANRLRSCVREMDTVARFGGDEFVVVVSELDADKTESTAQAANVAEKILATVSEPYLLTIRHAGKADVSIEHHCTASIGVTLFIDQEPGQDDILKWADAAMYQAKAAGGNSIRFYDPQA